MEIYMVNDLESYGLSMIIWLVVFRHPAEKDEHQIGMMTFPVY
jgi:hypothetical protein